jgi:hypothetical protein
MKDGERLLALATWTEGRVVISFGSQDLLGRFLAMAPAELTSGERLSIASRSVMNVSYTPAEARDLALLLLSCAQLAER